MQLQHSVGNLRNGVARHATGRPAAGLSPWDDPTPRAERHVITPEIAEMLLRRNTTNRKPKKAQVAYIAQQLRDGLWRENGETIILDQRCDLLDGQHRLMACVESGVPMPTLVAFGVESTSFTTIGRGVKRSGADDLYILKEPYSVNLAATLSMIALEESGEFNLRQFKRLEKEMAE